MADYYHDARKAKRALKDVADDNKRRREERRALGVEDDGVEHPWNLLSIDGRGCKLYKNKEQHDAVERQEGLIPWNGDPDNLIDRFDARSLLDFYREPPPNAAQKPKTPEEEKLHTLLSFESYRDLVRMAARGLSEPEGLRAAAAENLEARAAMRVVATAAFRHQSHLAAPGAGEAAKPAAGAGMYSNMGFSYGTGAPATDNHSSSSSSSSDDDDDDDAQAEPLRPEEDEHERQDELAESYGISDFSYRLHRALEQEGEQEAALMHRPRRRKGRKRERERARRMAGMGLDPRTGQARNIDWRDPIATNAPSAHLVMPRRRRDSPDARGGARGRSRSASRSRSPGGREGGRTYITEWGGDGGDGGAGGAGAGATRTALPSIASGHIDRNAFKSEEGLIIDALPGLADPAQSGAQFFPIMPAMQNIRQQQELRRRSRSRSRSRDRYRRRSRSRSRSRERDRRRSSRSRSRDRYRRRSRSRSSSRGRSGAKGGSSSGRGAQGGTSSAGTSGNKPSATAAKPGGGGPSAAAGAGPAGETPAERLKRIMAAQINKAATKDSVVATQKKIQAEKEKAARAQIERLARRHSPRRGRSRSRSPPGYRRYSRSRSR